MSDLKLYTLAEAAEILQVKEMWLQRKLQRREVPGRKLAGHWRLTQSDLEAVIEAAAVPVIAPKPDPAGLAPGSRRRMKRRGSAA
ncbi:helix-turn-helix domain-containing protein [Nocardia fusca]|uniref:Helix-turn-helix domain-containing protein n=1 Tax=Nocardia fusca TaxID=941183 RepID=A0ABV3FIN6_9NOCA